MCSSDLFPSHDTLNVPQNYRAQIKAHFGVDVGENMSGMSTYIGGDSSSLDISEVVNTNLQSGTSQSEAVIAGKGVGSSQGSEKFEARDWGVLMCIYHNVPLLDYVSSAPDPQLFVSQSRYGFYWYAVCSCVLFYQW